MSFQRKIMKFRKYIFKDHCFSIYSKIHSKGLYFHLFHFNGTKTTVQTLKRALVQTSKLGLIDLNPSSNVTSAALGKSFIL